MNLKDSFPPHKRRLRLAGGGMALLAALLITGAGALERRAHAADPPPPPPPPEPVASKGDGITQPKLLDGVTMEAVETYANPRSSEISLGIGVYPFDSYYYGMSINAGYTYHFSRNF